MKKTSLKMATLFLALVMLLTACGGGNAPANGGADKPEGEQTASAEGKILRTNNTSEPGALDPDLATGTHDSWVLQHLFEGLMKYDENGELVNGMAKDYKVSDDGLNWTFTIRDDVKWSNGDPVTAQDFEFAWKRLLDPELASDYAYQLYYLKNAEAYNAGEGNLTADDVGVKAADDKTLEVTLENPTPYFQGLTAFYSLYPVHKATVEANPDWAKDPSTGHYVSNGPFILKEWAHNDYIKLEKNPNYYDADKVKLAGIEFDILEDENTSYQKYEGGEYDLIVSPPSTVIQKMKSENNPELHLDPQIGTYYFAFNTQKKPFDNAKVRHAFSMALDRQTIIDNVVLGGQLPGTGMVPPGLHDDQGKDFREANGAYAQEDATKAKALLEEGLKEAGASLADLNGTVLIYNTSEGHKKIAQAVQDMWKKNLGVDITLENMEFQVLIDRRRAGDFSISRAGWIGDYADPMTMLDLFTTGNPQNDAKWSNPEFDKNIKIAKTSNDAKVRMDAMKAAEKVMMDDMPIIPLYFYNQSYLVKPNVKGVYKPLLDYPELTFAEIE